MRQVTLFFVMCLLKGFSAQHDCEPTHRYLWLALNEEDLNHRIGAELYEDPVTRDVIRYNKTEGKIAWIVLNNTDTPVETTVIFNKYLEACFEKVKNLNLSTFNVSDPVTRVENETVADFVSYWPSLSPLELLYLIDLFKMNEEYYEAYYRSYEYLTATNFTNSSVFEQCFHCQYVNFFAGVKENAVMKYEDLWWVYIYHNYIESTLAIILFCTGIVMDGMLIFLFLRYKEMRTEPNLIIFNLAFCDLLAITVDLPLGHFYFQDNIEIPDFVWNFLLILDFLLPLSSGLTVFALSMQRYSAVNVRLKRSRSAEMNKALKVLLYLLFLWGIPIILVVICFSPWLFNIPPSDLTTFSVLTILLIQAMAMPIVVSVINFIISRRLNKSAKNIPGEVTNTASVERSRSKSATVITVLALTFWLTNMPLFVVYFIRNLPQPPRTWPKVHYVHDMQRRVVIMFCYNLFYLNATVNPLALFIISDKYRKLLLSSFRSLIFWK